jgi:hypothetical protein
VGTQMSIYSLYNFLYYFLFFFFLQQKKNRLEMVKIINKINVLRSAQSRVHEAQMFTTMQTQIMRSILQASKKE